MSNSNDSEVWRDVKGYENLYEVSSFGGIRKRAATHSLKTRWGTTVRRKRQARTLKPSPSSGYMLVWLHKEGESKKFAVHWLVLEAFVGPRPKGMEGCHNDGNFRNNRADNLRWDTHKGNHQDRIRHGTNNRGEKNGSAVVTESDVVRIRELYATNKYLVKEIAEMYGLTESGVGNILKRKVWKHVGGPVKPDFGRGHARLSRLVR